MKELLNKYGMYVVTVLLLLAAGVWFVFGRGTQGLPQQAFFIDEDTGVESVQPASLVPPLQGAKGNMSVVKVYKYAAGGDSTVKVGYYFKYTPEMKSKIEEVQKHPEGNELTPSTGMLVRSPQAGSAVGRASSAAGKNIQEVSPGSPVESVYP